ncbi:hypothetical protein BU23DRAFT_647781 [Bimuria novae-zelandiae CBS 107.79]|uniref:Uncharacterized protein n=1 Tax=Bimuria novae-zelandiae CBS 107.79 TaxID=1447943 RepID=A0A6A5VQF2_9PLEO|nr:hypothetical protein BU23DRAFT_647781 [Bimuria novae-zelandiae CBS 107.79]
MIRITAAAPKVSVETDEITREQQIAQALAHLAGARSRFFNRTDYARTMAKRRKLATTQAATRAAGERAKPDFKKVSYSPLALKANIIKTGQKAFKKTGADTVFQSVTRLILANEEAIKNVDSQGLRDFFAQVNCLEAYMCCVNKTEPINKPLRRRVWEVYLQNNYDARGLARPASMWTAISEFNDNVLADDALAEVAHGDKVTVFLKLLRYISRTPLNKKPGTNPHLMSRGTRRTKHTPVAYTADEQAHLTLGSLVPSPLLISRARHIRS